MPHVYGGSFDHFFTKTGAYYQRKVFKMGNIETF